MTRLRWTASQNHYESLAVSLRAVLAHFQQDRSYDELLAALGLGTATVAVPDDPLGWWCTCARDLWLAETAKLYGLQLREMHPPQTALGLGRSPEYAQHFRDSYVPLVARALEHEQLVLAWCGWPSPCDRLWGVITHVDGQMLVGQTLSRDRRSLPLTGPANQLYIVEGFDPPGLESATPTDFFDHAARAASAMWSGAWAAELDIQMGPSAYQVWQTTLRASAKEPAATPSLHSQQSRATRVHAAARTYLATWLRRIAGALAGDRIQMAAHWANACDRIAERLLPYESADVVRELLDQPGGVDRICRALDDICALESNVVETLETLTSPGS